MLGRTAGCPGGFLAPLLMVAVALGLGPEAAPEQNEEQYRVAFSSMRDGNSEIYVTGVGESQPRNLTQNPGRDANPSWSPDGSKIAFLSERGKQPGLYVMNADG
ncbi:MAG: PD40 domain-containing protein, partial [Armatimonadota bacterium]